jgi:hypothetical protein
MTSANTGGSENEPTGIFIDNRKNAVISDCGNYRYRLTRTWNTEKGTIVFLMLNPSTADVTNNDPTIRRCINFAKDWGYGSLIVGNLFALRTSDPSNLDEHESPIGPKNDSYLQKICKEANMVVAAWGANEAIETREQEVISMLDVDLYALNTTKDNHPSHPLYQEKDTKPTLWKPSQ